MANKLYNDAKVQMAKGLLDLSDATKMKVMLVSTSYVGTSDIDSDTMTQVNAGEISGTGYVAGGKLLTNAAVTVDDANDLAKLDGDDLTWGSSTITAGGAVIWYDDTSDYPIALIDFGGDKVSSAGDFKITWDANGILTLN